MQAYEGVGGGRGGGRVWYFGMTGAPIYYKVTIRTQTNAIAKVTGIVKMTGIGMMTGIAKMTGIGMMTGIGKKIVLGVCVWDFQGGGGASQRG